MFEPMYRLFFLNGKHRGKRLVVQQSTLLIGRGSDCQISLDDDDRVSHHHAVIEMRVEGPVIRDLGAASRVQVNQKPVVEHRLRHGDRIEIGGTVIEFYRGEKTLEHQQERRLSKTQVVSIMAISLVVLVQIGFVIFFPIWQLTETVQIPKPPKEKRQPEPVAAVAKVESQPEPSPTPAAPQPTPAPVVEQQPAPVSTPPPVQTPSPTPEPSPSPTPEPTPVEVVQAPVATPTPPPEPQPDPFLIQAKESVDSAKSMIKRGEFSKADNLLDKAQLTAPGYVPAWEERARLFERREMYAESVEQWERVMKLTEGTPAYDKAAKEKKRVAGMKAAPVPTAPPDVVKPVVPAAPSITIGKIERERFQADNDYEEMRVVRIPLQPDRFLDAADTAKIRVVAEFFDRIEGSTRVVPTRATVDADGLKISGSWPSGERRTVTASYAIPAGFRATEYRDTGERRTFEGVRISVYYDGALKQRQAIPRSLLQAP